MAIPDYQTIMLPLLKFAGDSQEHSLRETIDYLADEFKLSNDERNTTATYEVKKIDTGYFIDE